MIYRFLTGPGICTHIGLDYMISEEKVFISGVMVQDMGSSFTGTMVNQMICMVKKTV
jgi:hypothetical protein